MDFGKAFTYPFEDPEWVRKIIVPALIGIIPILGQIFLGGWMLDVTRRVIRQDPTPLPEIDFGKQFMDGLKSLVIGLVYAIPILILDIPIIAVALSTQESGNVDTNNALIAGVSLCCGGLIFLYAIALSFLAPAAMANFAAKDQLSAAFKFREVIALVRAAPGAYLLTLIGAWVSIGIIAPLGAIACGVGALLTTAYAMAINGHLYGQAYNEASRNMGFARVY